MQKELLINGDQSFERILTRIREAKSSIYINMFIWRDDAIGNEMARTVLAAADRGVQITIVKDLVGSIFEKGEECRQSLFHKEFNLGIALQQLVVSRLYFRHVSHLDGRQKPNPLAEKIMGHPHVNFRASLRNDHSKFYIFDDEILIAGGVNIEDKEVSLDYLSRKWCDYMIEIIDPAIVDYFVRKLNNPGLPSEYPEIEFIFNINTRNIYQVKTALLQLLDEARERVDIEMAYWGDPDVTGKIIECINRGLQVTLLTSRESNLQDSLNHRVLDKISRAALKPFDIYLTSRVVHSKLVCVDDRVLFFGSANYNKKGMLDLSELNILLADDAAVIDTWKSWRERHIREECTHYAGKTTVRYNKLLALAESIIC